MNNLCVAALSYLSPTPLYGFAIDYKCHLLKGWPVARLIERGGAREKYACQWTCEIQPNAFLVTSIILLLG